MAAPGFSAQASLYNSIHYYATVLAHGVDFSNSAVPSLPIRNGGGNGGCHVDCTPCDASCRKTCTNSCTGRSVTSSCCSSGFSCQNGTCVCPAPKTVCGSVCTNLASDPSNCGGCGHTCPAGSTCQQGTCFPTPPVCTCSHGTQTCCSMVSPDQRQCGVRSCSPGCDPALQPYPWCGQSSPNVVQCDCPAGEVCGPKCAGGLCSVDWYCQPAPPTCKTTTGRCTGAGGADQCIIAGGVTQCCHSNWLYGWFPWITVCSDGTVTQGCNGPCW